MAVDILDKIIFVLCVIHAISYTLAWWWSDKAIVVNSLQIICVLSLWGVVTYFAYFSQIPKFHMLWAYPTALLGTGILAGYIYRVILNLTKNNGD